jgi:hypothetical protein
MLNPTWRLPFGTECSVPKPVVLYDPHQVCLCSIIAPFHKKVERTFLGPICKLQVEANLIHVFVSLRYAGVIWFIFHVLQLLPIRFTQQNLCCINISMMKHLQEPNWKSDFPWLFMVIESACLLTSWLNTYVLPIVVTIECRIVSYTWGRRPISFKHVSSSSFLNDPHWTTFQSNLGVQWRKWATSDPSTVPYW